MRISELAYTYERPQLPLIRDDSYVRTIVSSIGDAYKSSYPGTRARVSRFFPRGTKVVTDALDQTAYPRARLVGAARSAPRRCCRRRRSYLRNLVYRDIYNDSSSVSSPVISRRSRSILRTETQSARLGEFSGARSWLDTTLTVSQFCQICAPVLHASYV